MKKLFSMILVVASLLSFGCTMIPIEGPNEIKGSKAKAEIQGAADEARIIKFASLSSLYAGTGMESYLSMVFVMGKVIDDIVVPTIAGIDDSKMYKKDTVDDCVGIVKSTGILLGTWVGSATCKVEEVSLIQLGPIGVP